MDTTVAERYVVHSSGKKSRLVTRQQIIDMCAAGRMSPDATVVAESSTLHKTILVFLSETQTSDAALVTLTDSSPLPRKRGWLSKAVMLLFFLMLLGNLYSVYQIHRLFSAQGNRLMAQFRELQKDLDQVVAAQQQPVPAPVPAGGGADDPLAGRPAAEQSEIRRIVSTINDYRQVLQELTSEGTSDSPAGRTADETISRLMERLQTDFGVRPGPLTGPQQNGQRNGGLSASGH